MKIEVGEGFRAWKAAGLPYVIVRNVGIFCCEAGAVAWPHACPWHDVNQKRLESDDLPSPVGSRGGFIESDSSLNGLEKAETVDRKLWKGVVLGVLAASVFWAILIWVIILVF